jgi:hypothetical protein
VECVTVAVGALLYVVLSTLCSTIWKEHPAEEHTDVSDSITRTGSEWTRGPSSGERADSRVISRATLTLLVPVAVLRVREFAGTLAAASVAVKGLWTLTALPTTAFTEWTILKDCMLVTTSNC